THDLDRFANGFHHAVDVRASKPSPARAMQDLDPAGVPLGETVGELTGSVRRLVVDHHDPDAWMLHQSGDQDRQVRALVLGRHEHESVVTHDRGPSKRSEEICSDTRPIRKITTLSIISSTEELVTCDCVAMVHAA